MCRIKILNPCLPDQLSIVANLLLKIGLKNRRSLIKCFMDLEGRGGDN